MNKQREYLACSEALSLLTLRIVLTDARRDVPPHVSINDMNEELAAELLEKMKRQYKKYLRYFSSMAVQQGVDW
jgi:hypothetical protein